MSCSYAAVVRTGKADHSLVDIDKTYNAPPPRPRRTTNDLARPSSSEGSPRPMSPGSINSVLNTAIVDDELPPKTRPLIGEFDLFRQTDLSTCLLLFYMILLTALTPKTAFTKTLFVLHAAAWRVWHTVGIGSVLMSQSKSKGWIRHFVKVGEGRIEAWTEWKGIYHISLIGCWASFFMAGWKCYSLPETWGYGNSFALLTHTLGMVSSRYMGLSLSFTDILPLVVDHFTSLDRIIYLREFRRVWLVLRRLFLRSTTQAHLFRYLPLPQ